VGQAFVIERHAIDKKSGRETLKNEEKIAFGVTSRKPEEADAKAVLTTNRGHWEGVKKLLPRHFPACVGTGL
jgi:hypothetical protein